MRTVFRDYSLSGLERPLTYPPPFESRFLFGRVLGRVFLFWAWNLPVSGFSHPCFYDFSFTSVR